MSLGSLMKIKLSKTPYSDGNFVYFDCCDITIKIKGACEGLLYQTSDTLISVKKFSLFQYCILYT